jgi:hypothetical protein
MPAPRQFEAVSAAVSPNLVDIECDGLMAALGVQFVDDFINDVKAVAPAVKAQA